MCLIDHIEQNETYAGYRIYNRSITYLHLGVEKDVLFLIDLVESNE